MSRSLIRPAVLGLERGENEEPEQEVAVRAHRNEAALAAPIHVVEAVRTLNGTELARYPADLMRLFTEGLAHRLETRSGRLAIGSGADDILAAIGRAVLDPGDTVVTVRPTFGMYAWLAGVANAKLRTLPYTQRWKIDVDALVALGQGARLVILGHPNNPTGEALEARTIVRVAQELSQALIVIDEVYLSLSRASLISTVRALPNVAVVGSLSKVGALAGMRIGYAVAGAELASALRRVMPPFPVGVASLVAADAYARGGAATAAFEVELAQQTRRSLDAIVVQVGCFAKNVWRSLGNFVLMDFGQSGEALAAALRMRGIAVRSFNEPELWGCLRFCALDDLATARLIAAVQEAAAALGMRAARA
jgi:histidinol-phosphate aminotransferase